jgi:endonuclease III-like uncharacterized protein
MDENLEDFKEFHALIDELAKQYCKPKPNCAQCVVSGLCKSTR